MSPSPHRGRAVPVALAAAALLLVSACAGGDNEPASTSPSPSPTATASASVRAGDITMEDFAFSPANPEVRPGQKITVVNKDRAAHTVTATEGSAFDTGNIPGGRSGTFTAPSEAGRYDFVCTNHPDMKGTLIVR